MRRLLLLLSLASLSFAWGPYCGRFTCPTNAYCDERRLVCVCLPYYIPKGRTCLPPQGPPGPPGPPGVSGAPGAPGPEGATGAPGANGSDGANGANGLDGAEGATGAPGNNGIDGANGEDGAEGATGAPGPPGRDGRDGASAGGAACKGFAFKRYPGFRVKRPVAERFSYLPLSGDGEEGNALPSLDAGDEAQARLCLRICKNDPRCQAAEYRPRDLAGVITGGVATEGDSPVCFIYGGWPLHYTATESHRALEETLTPAGTERILVWLRAPCHDGCCIRYGATATGEAVEFEASQLEDYAGLRTSLEACCTLCQSEQSCETGLFSRQLGECSLYSKALSASETETCEAASPCEEDAVVYPGSPANATTDGFFGVHCLPPSTEATTAAATTTTTTTSPTEPETSAPTTRQTEVTTSASSNGEGCAPHSPYYISALRFCIYEPEPNLKVNWTTAEAKCVELGGHLASINDQADLNGLLSAFAGFPASWIGGMQDAAAEAADRSYQSGAPAGPRKVGWTWSDGTGPVPDLWFGKEPTDANNNEACLAIWPGTWHGGFGDSGCHSPPAKRFLCGFPLQDK